MKKYATKYRAISLGLILAILPSLLGVHIFQHHCTGCNQDETIARIITTMHSHEHDCTSCSCASTCQSCHNEVGKHIHHQASGEGSCQHDFKKASFEAQTNTVSFRIEATSLDLLFHAGFYTEVQLSYINTHKDNCNVIHKIPDEPSPQMNCVFLL